MKSAVAFCVLVLAAVALARPDGDHYSDKHDQINIDEALENDNLRKNYMNCVLDEGKCTPDGKELRDIIPDALKTGCSKCTAAQKEKSRKVMSYIIHKDPENWKKLCAKYDPENKYASKYEQELREIEG